MTGEPQGTARPLAGRSHVPGRVPVRDDLVDVEPYGAPQLDVPVRLNTNETPYPPPGAFMERLAEAVGSLELHRYPDRRAWALRTALGERVGLPPERVWAANGSNEVLLQLFQAYGGAGRRVLLTRPGYSAHPLIARVAATQTVSVELDDDLDLSAAAASAAVAQHDPDIVCIANPNNPTGMTVDLEVIRTLHDTSRALVVLDEAYIEFAVAEGAVSGVGLLDELPRLVVCRTFSKAFRMAGLRLGYLYAHDWVIDDLRKVRLPYHMDAMTQAAGIVACELADDVTAHIADVVAERSRVAAALEAVGAAVYPSAANYLLFRSPDVLRSASGASAGTEHVGRGLFDRLLEHGVLIRDFSDKPRLEGCLRVTIGTPEENDRFLQAMDVVCRSEEAAS